jgi:RNA polymerase sigma-70 factor (ECF subfamily)
MRGFQTALEDEAFVALNDESASAESRVLAERTDRQLVDVVLAGDETAFEQLFDRHKHMVVKLAGRYFRQPEEAEEILQITFAKAFVELEKFRGLNEFSLPGWLRRIAINACIDVLRGRRRKPEDLCCELNEAETAAMAAISASGKHSTELILSDRDLINKLLSHLDAEDRAILQMLYTEEMSVAEIGKILGWSASKVKIRAWRSRRSLRKLLAKYM